MLRKRWVQIVLLGLAILVINVAARFVTWKFHIVDEEKQLNLAFVAVLAVAVLLAGASAWWAVRYPFGRLVADIGAAVGIGALLSLLIGPFAGGAKPFEEGLGAFVGQLLMFVGVAAVGVALGFMAVVTFGKDWKSRGLRRYEKDYAKRPHRAVRG